MMPALAITGRGQARRTAIAATLALTFAATCRLHAYVLIGGAWASGNITMQLQLDATAPASPALPLTDGTGSWNGVAQAAMADWNANLGRSQLTGIVNPSTAAADGDHVNNIFFSPTIYDQSFGAHVLAVTLVDNNDSDGIPSVKIKEADLIVNKNRTWNSYRGGLQSGVDDLRRVLLHELGHVLGLDHPDKATPRQTVSAIMNSTISNLETLQTDDVNGVKLLYNTPLVVPSSVEVPASRTVSVTGATTINVTVNGGTPPDAGPLLDYVWYFEAKGATTFEPLFTIHSVNLDLGVAQLTDAGTYHVEVRTPDTTTDSNDAALNVTPIAIDPTTYLVNVSTRALAGSSTQPMTVGFVISGSRSKNVLIRAVGPTLGQSPFSLPGTLADPQLVLKDQNQKTIATSPARWDSDSATAQTLRDTFPRVGAFALAPGTADAVLLVSLPGGNMNYTAQALSPSGQTGIVLVEAYDADTQADRDANPTSRIINLSTRGFVGTDNNIMIAGFSVYGPGPHTYLIRVAGPTLAQNPWNVAGTLYDPYLKLFTADATPRLLRENDDWDSPSATQPVLSSAFTNAGAFNLTDRKESAMLVTLPPGSYTAQASGNDNQGQTDPTGQALIEIYQVN
jgi:hypothetical protein